jgi:hypothetical protein
VTVHEPGAAEYNAPVIRKNEWLVTHPSGKIRHPYPGEPDMEAAVGGKVIATAYDDLESLMDAVDRAESQGCCPLHPATRPGTLSGAPGTWPAERAGRSPAGQVPYAGLADAP